MPTLTCYVWKVSEQKPIKCIIEVPLADVTSGVGRLGDNETNGSLPKLSYVKGIGSKVRVPAEIASTPGTSLTINLPWGAQREVRPNDNLIVPDSSRGVLKEAAKILYDEVTILFDAYASSVVGSPDV